MLLSTPAQMPVGSLISNPKNQTSSKKLFVHFFVRSKETNKKKYYKIFVPLLCLSKEGVPPRKDTLNVSRFRLAAELPSPGTC